MGNLISKSSFNDCFKHWKCFLLIFLVVWNLNFLHRIHRHFWIKLIPKLGEKTALGMNVSFNNFMRANKSDVANTQKMFLCSGMKCNMFSKLWMAPLVHNLDGFSSEKRHVFHLAGRWLPPLCLLYLTKEICWFLFPWNDVQFVVLFAITKVNSVLFPCLFPLHNSWFEVLVNADNMSKMNSVFSMIFHTNTITYTDV